MRRVHPAFAVMGVGVGIMIGGTACGSDADATAVEEGPNVVIDVSDDPGEITDKEFDYITIKTPDRPNGMPCVIWKDHRDGTGEAEYAYSGLTCDWSPK